MEWDGHRVSPAPLLRGLRDLLRKLPKGSVRHQRASDILNLLRVIIREGRRHFRLYGDLRLEQSARDLRD